MIPISCVMRLNSVYSAQISILQNNPLLSFVSVNHLLQALLAPTLKKIIIIIFNYYLYDGGSGGGTSYLQPNRTINVILRLVSPVTVDLNKEHALPE